MPIWSPWKWNNPKLGSVEKTTSWNLPIRKDRTGGYRLMTTAAPVLVCPGSSFFAPGAAECRRDAMQMMRERRDLFFLLFAERAEEVRGALPPDWGREDDNIGISLRIRSQEEADRLLSLIREGGLPFSHREIRAMPLTAPLNLQEVLKTGAFAAVSVSGDENPQGAVLDFAFAEDLLLQCRKTGTAFTFLSTGARILAGGRAYAIPAQYRESQAKKAGLDFLPEGEQEPVKIRIEKERALSSGDLLKDKLFLRLSQSGFRSGFALSEKDRAYIRRKGMETIRQHAADFVAQRLAPAHPENDGKQTPMRGHPVFTAQHATGCCCRGCLSKWHGIPEGRLLTDREQAYVTDILMEWIRRQLL
jgi:hypothetical protein